MNYTMREIDNYARGVDIARRSEMATMLWAAWEGAAFTGFAFAGKRLPSIDRRLRRIMTHGRVDERRSEVARVIASMRQIAEKAGLPPPRPRRRKRDGV